MYIYIYLHIYICIERHTFTLCLHNYLTMQTVYIKCVYVDII